MDYSLDISQIDVEQQEMGFYCALTQDFEEKDFRNDPMQRDNAHRYF